MSDAIYPVLLCGGSGTRLWPHSRKSYPKQFVELIENESLFQLSANRVSGEGFAAPTLVTTFDFRFVVAEHLAALKIVPADTLIEPMMKNTAAAICAAALTIDAQTPDALMLVVPSDHVIPDDILFRETVSAAVSSAKNNQVITFGIRPNRPETGYGWLELSQKPDSDFSTEPHKVCAFIEKPDLTKAKTLLEGGRHLWNSGIFLFTTTVILDAFKRYAPKTLELTQAALDAAQKDLSFTLLAPETWEQLPDISIDYAIMERADNLMVLPFEGVWSDLGDWQAVWRESDRDNVGVVVNGPATSLDCSDTLLHATSSTQVLVGIGLKDIIAVAMPDAVLVAHKDRTQDVKKAVSELKARGVAQAETLPIDYRPWGWYERLVVGSRFQVKRIVVNPSSSLSLQSHYHRSEHWIVVEGTAKVTVDEVVTLVAENQSVYIPLGATHRLENPGKVPLTLIEVQTGNYFGEDDIIRYDDMYARG